VDGTVRLRISFDGGCDPNPGPGYGSFLIERTDGPGRSLRRVVFDWLGDVTNNQCEYLTLIESLHAMPPMPAGSEIELVGDSRIVLYQVSGVWETNDPLLSHLNRAVRRLVQPYDVRCRWVRRDEMVALFGH
jgi:ribonuclease HI